MESTTPSQPEIDANRAARQGTIRERRRYCAARRASAQERDRRRRQLARASTVDLTIDPDQGFARIDPGALRGVSSVVADVSALMAGLGPNPPGSGKDHLTTNILAQESLDLDSSYMRLALDDEILDAASEYLGVVPVLNTIDVWHSRPAGYDEPRSTQLFHLDKEDVSQVKLFVHCSDVTENSGPLTVLDAGSSRRLAKKLGYRPVRGRATDEDVAEIVGDAAEPISLTGSAGTAHLVDTSRCFHFGSRVEADSPPRTVAMFQYLTPYSFVFLRDHREEAPYCHLSSDGLPELHRLVLGDG